MPKLRVWLDGALIAFLDGVLTAASIQLVTGFDLTPTWLKALGAAALAGGLTSFGRYLQRSPIPHAEETPKE